MNQENKKPDDAPNCSPEHRARIEALFDKLRDKLERSFKFRLRAASEEARELTQEVYTRLLRPPKREVHDWEARLWRVARNLRLDTIEERNLQRDKAPLMDEPDEDHRTPESSWSDDEDHAAILRAIDDLPKRQQLVLRRYSEGQSFAQMALELGVAERTCRRDFVRAIVAIQRIIGLGRSK